MRSREYQEWLNGVDNLPPDEISEATDEEIGWQKQKQIKDAIHAMRSSIATPEQLHLLWEHNVPVSVHAKERIEEKLRRRGEELPYRFKKE